MTSDAQFWTSLSEEAFWGFYTRFLYMGVPADVDLNGGQVAERMSIDFVSEAIRRNPLFTTNLTLARWTEVQREKPIHLVTAYALCCATSSDRHNQQARKSFHTVCQDSRSLLKFVQVYHAYGQSGGGRSLRRLLAEFYLRAQPQWLQEQVTQCFCAYGWSHRDVIQLARPWSDDPKLQAVLNWIKSQKKPPSGQHHIVPRGPKPYAPLQTVRPATCFVGPGVSTQAAWFQQTFASCEVISLEAENLPKLRQVEFPILVLPPSEREDSTWRTHVVQAVQERSRQRKPTAVLYPSGGPGEEFANNLAVLRVTGTNKSVGAILSKFFTLPEK